MDFRYFLKRINIRQPLTALFCDDASGCVSSASSRHINDDWGKSTPISFSQGYYFRRRSCQLVVFSFKESLRGLTHNYYQFNWFSFFWATELVETNEFKKEKCKQVLTSKTSISIHSKLPTFKYYFFCPILSLGHET